MESVKKFLQSFVYLGLLYSIILIISCASTSDWAQRISWEDLELVDIPGQEAYPDAGAIILLDEGRMEIFGGDQIGFSVFNHHRIVKILNPRGLPFVNVSIPYHSDAEVNHIQARTITPEGEIIVLDDENIYDVSAYTSFIFYSDQRAKLFTMPAVENGSIIEYRYSIRIWNRTLWHSWIFQNTEPTLLSRFSLIEPSEWKVNHRLYHIDVQPQVTGAPEGFKSTYVWEVRNVAPVKSEYAMPSANEILARLEFAPVGVQEWDDVAKWYFDLSDPQTVTNSEIKDQVLNLTVQAKTDEEKLKAIYEWVRDHIRYIAVSIGIGGYQPNPVSEIYLSRYGDCKDMTTLLCAMAREAGIEAYQALISTWPNGKIDPELPSPFQFNHVIGYFPAVGDSGIWLDATEKGCPFNQLPWYDRGLSVLAVGEKGRGEMMVTPRSPEESNRVVFDWNVYLESSGAAVVQGRTLYSGARAAELREELIYASQDEQRRWIVTFLAERCCGVVLDSFHIDGLQPVRDPLVIEYALHTDTFILPQSQKMIFRPSVILSLGLASSFRAPERAHPIRIPYAFQDSLDLTVQIPQGWIVETSMMSDSLRSPFGSANWSWAFDEKEIQIETNYQLSGRDIVPEDYHAFQAFLDSIHENDLRDIILVNREGVGESEQVN
ncbi:DUF3857 domain-containing protein [bacterium]|nr:DUF3857 domain-containing protein [bacterium]RQV92087.1 MAG: DUF3857 domain-containing protein [bacterium]